MKKKFKIITTILTTIVVAAVATTSIVLLSSGKSLSHEEKSRLYAEQHGIPEELTQGKYYYQGDKESGYYIEIGSGYSFSYEAENPEKTAKEMSDKQGDEFYDGYIWNIGRKTYYAIECLEISDVGMQVCVFNDVKEPGSNHQMHSGSYVEYINSTTLRSTDGDYILVE